MNLVDYLNRYPNGSRVLLGVIDPDGTPIRISDNVYRTEPSDSLASKKFNPIIETVPRLSREVRSPWGGGVSGSWGPVKVATKMAGSVDLSTESIKGKKFHLFQTIPRFHQH